MKEIYSNDLNIIDIYTAVRGESVAPTGTPTAKIYLGETKTFTSAATNLTVTQVIKDSEPVVGHYRASIPHSLVARNRYAKVEITYTLPVYGAITTSDVYEIAQRLVGYNELKDYLGVDSSGEPYELDWHDYDKLECVIRRVVETYCGQKFNCWQGSRRITSARDFIPLPQHLEKITTIETSDNLVPVLNDVDVMYLLEEGGLAIDKNSDFQTPNILTARSKNNVTHVITGLWGYETVPEQVVQAALEVIEFFRTDDVNARRKFLSYITNDASVNMNFNWTSYTDSTGNPIADDLLDPFRVYNVGAV